MSLPPELRVLCFHLSNTPAVDLPHLLPRLLSQVLRCQAPLSISSKVSAKNDSSASASSVLVHKLKTQLSTLLNGKSLEGRFAAIVLIKGVVEVGGWEVLQGSESWVRGLLAVLGVRTYFLISVSLILTKLQKNDSPVTKELCIITLTKIYRMTHQYQTLVREITTPTLPTFISSCLNLIAPKSSGKVSDIPLSLIEIIFQSFASLLPRHTTIYRPFVSQIRNVAKPYLAPTSLTPFVSSSLKQSARSLIVALHQTVAKNAGGEAWGKAVRDIVKNVHVTADQVFRAVVEDWESTAGFIAGPVDVNEELSGGGEDVDDLPSWSGISAGTERLVGLLGILEEYLRHETSTPVSIPLGSIMDLFARILSIAIPSTSRSSSRSGGTRLHPAIDRDERDELWAGMPRVYVASVQALIVIATRLQGTFVPLAPTLLDQVAWVFPSGKHDPSFRAICYDLISTILRSVGQSQNRRQISKLSLIIRSCCHDLFSIPSELSNAGVAQSNEVVNSNGKRPHAQNQNHNADTFLKKFDGDYDESAIEDTDLIIAASKLLPLFASHIPQQYLDISLRSLIERTAIVTHNKQAMVACVLSPFVGKNGKTVASILPHLSRYFPNEDIVETLLRPRMPLVPSTSTAPDGMDGDIHTEIHEDYDEDIDMLIVPVADRESNISIAEHVQPPLNAHGFGGVTSAVEQVPLSKDSRNIFGGRNQADAIGSFLSGAAPDTTSGSSSFGQQPILPAETHLQVVEGSTNASISQPIGVAQLHNVSHKDASDSDSDDESVHLVMGLDSDSEGDA